MYTVHEQKRLFRRLQKKTLTSPFASATPISYNRGINLLSEYMFAMFWQLL